MDFASILRNITKGDVQGHAFHGNQWTEGISGSTTAEERIEKIARNRMNLMLNSQKRAMETTRWKEIPYNSDVSKYIAIGNDTLNRWLRNGSASDFDQTGTIGNIFSGEYRREGVAEEINSIDKQLASTPTDGTYYAARFTGNTFMDENGKQINVNDLKVGQIITDPAYQSTTLNPKLFFQESLTNLDDNRTWDLLRDAKPSFGRSRSSEMLMTIPEGVPALFRPTSPYSGGGFVSVKDEAELLLGRDLKMEVTSIDHINARNYNQALVSVRVIAPDNLIPPLPPQTPVLKGDVKGHKFHGNQWIGGDLSRYPIVGGAFGGEFGTFNDVLYNRNLDKAKQQKAEATCAHCGKIIDPKTAWLFRDLKNGNVLRSDKFFDPNTPEARAGSWRLVGDTCGSKQAGAAYRVRYSEIPESVRPPLSEIEPAFGAWNHDASKVYKGDVEGHEFHGNQYTEGRAGFHLTGKDYEGKTGRYDHITRNESGTIPTDAIKFMLGASGEKPFDHRMYKGDDWEKFKADIAKNGIKEPIFITVDYDGTPVIAEGNHRRDAAVELGMKEVPVEVRYFGNAQQQGTIAERPFPTSDLSEQRPLWHGKPVQKGDVRGVVRLFSSAFPQK
jgi:hypothetical protein